MLEYVKICINMQCPQKYVSCAFRCIYMQKICKIWKAL